jgi:hypothetical protein
MSKTKTRLFDVLWVVIILIWIAVLVVPSTRDWYLKITGAQPYWAGFVNFAILATMGDLLAGRIRTGGWILKVSTIFKLIVWGFIGVTITLFFGLTANGVADLQKANMLPFGYLNPTSFWGTLAHAFMTSVLINVSFGPAMFIFHKFADTYIDAKFNKLPSNAAAMIERIDWKTFFKFSVFTMVPCFWIPCHTIVFCLPTDYRVLMAAFLSIALGLFLSLKNKAATKSK